MGICIILNTTDLQVYYNMVSPVPQSEWYATMQLNYFTNSIKINDRFIFGTVDSEVRENNSVYKVKAVIKANTTHTFVKDSNDEINSTPLLILALDKDAISPQDNFTTRIANNAPVFLIPTDTDKSEKVIPTGDSTIPGTDTVIPDKVNTYTLQDKYKVSDHIRLGRSQTYTMELLYNDTVVDNPSVSYSVKLNNRPESEWSKHFIIEYSSTGIEFKVTNLKTFLEGTLDVTVTCNIPGSSETIDRTVSIILDKAY